MLLPMMRAAVSLSCALAFVACGARTASLGGSPGDDASSPGTDGGALRDASADRGPPQPPVDGGRCQATVVPPVPSPCHGEGLICEYGTALDPACNLIV